MAVTINDIAKAANVAPSTVSRVIANSELISEETRVRVLKIMKEMDYHPNMIARSLVNQSTKIIGVLLPGTSEKVFQHPFFPEILRGITSQAAKCGYKILLSNIASQSEEISAINELVNGCIVEGLILMTSRINDDSIGQLVSKKFPFVMVGRPESDWKNQFDWVDNNNVEAGYLLTKYFIKKERRNIAFIGVSQDYMVTLDRLAGYRKALEESKIAFDSRLVVDGKFMDGNGYEMVQELMSRRIPFDGIIAGDDFQAFAAINFLTHAGIHVPSDVAVAGFNNVPLSDYYMPSLTSVDVNACRLGETAFKILHERLGKRKSPSHYEFVKTEIIRRKSC